MAIELPYRIVDVFSDRPLAGNALCVVLEPAPDAVMQAIAAETNLSETTFVLNVGDGEYDVRIFTPRTELPFAGHPSLGTAWVLGPGTWTQRSPGTTVTIEVDRESAVMSQPDPAFTEVYPEDAGRALGLPNVTAAYVADVGGMRHLLVPTEHPVAHLRPDPAAMARATASVRASGLGVFTRAGDRQLKVRVFLPGAGIPEDPGTGSAAGAIALLARRTWGLGADLVVDQGAEVGRPCRIEVHAEEGAVRVGGRVAACAEGRFTL